MKTVIRLSACFAIATLFVTGASAQKIKTGYDKSVDFSKFKTYTLKSSSSQVSRPLLYQSVAGSIRQNLEEKGLVHKEKDGDLTIVAVGGVDYGLPSYNPLADTCDKCQAPLQDPVQWSGSPPPGGSSGKPQPEGTLEVDMIDTATNKLVWSGTVIQKLQPTNVDKSLLLAGKAVDKLMSEYPPKKEK
jgi:Domain of unknown function (DUF4136)